MDKANSSKSLFILPSEIELAQVADHYAALLAKCGKAAREKPLKLDLSEGPASAPALQLLIAARKLLDQRGAFSGFGPNVGPLLDQPTQTK